MKHYFNNTHLSQWKVNTLDEHFYVKGSQIVIKTLKGDNIVISVKPDEKIKDIKLKLQERENITIHQQKLLYGGKELDDNKYLSDYNIQSDSVLHLVLVQPKGK